ncbi:MULTISPECIES: M15 family metallopeptidase [Paraburkholderia]|uniref:Peptidoglycan L-alanyl-D-glutamate endopeptidase CwlK n=1 Tax=Paraburkholderia megapolitana TaxID=420953 RepID=A0A1I3TCZ5_9BURK|nr:MULTISPECIES: M15 family metallopeptidase [Paraburkholderia]MCX4165016.1 M15 family metallopeptidase [Paraburkholderia megapolitana]MDN7160509.1 M15 family metallopeptidase [Paraburkholderia sp. CHISQ3]MDQ6497556.1 M15 family metallopeptidase [Paraburkholderia megapolitana]QDQ81499.1 M15 family metallopeptidase [Paraburkholderia megapolitana]SFJ67601.1 peptidoglycan L-alanyl-D-glutamate endopeptidase CwlK [Paraburkholderia megapolitana]
MIAVALVAYFAIAVLVAAILLLPSVRASLFGGVFNLHNRIVRRASRGAAHARGTIAKSARISQSTLGDMQNLLVRRRLLIFTTTGILATPPLVAIALRGRQFFQYDDTIRVPDEKIAALLNGEQLVPPPPLPPEIFETQEVQQIRPALKGASRDWNLLDADFRTRLLLVYKMMHEQYGYEMALLEGYRSPERQNQLSKMGGVTNAAAFQSYHQYGLAADNAFLRDGKLVITEKDPWAMRGYQLYGQCAEQVGLTWGGRWKLMDLGHVEYHKPGFVMGKSKPLVVPSQ